MSFRKYAEYQESGVAWLGEIPAGWTTQKLKFVARVQPSNVDKKSKENEEKVLLCNYTDVYYNEEITADLPFMKATASDVQIRKFTLKSGDTIITKDSEDPNDIAVPAYVPKDLDGVVCGYHLALLRPENGTCGGYLKRVMDTHYARSFFATRANGITRYGLGIYAISNFILPFPPLEEQKQIAAFLDKETTKIDALVDKQEQLITLLREKRQAIISHAVTRGLNPNAKMKDSGIEWLGEVPEHWSCISLKNIEPYNSQMVQTGPFGAQLHASDYVDEGVPLILIKNVRNLSIDDSDIPKISIEDATRLSKYRVEVGDIVFSRVGSIGRIAKITEKERGWLISGQMLRLRFGSNLLNPEYSVYALSSKIVEDYVAYYSVGSTRDSINTEILMNLKIPLPPVKEQKQIAAFLDKETTKIDALVEKCETAIELLKERRIALISAAVTGKIDVRNTI